MYLPEAWESPHQARTLPPLLPCAPPPPRTHTQAALRPLCPLGMGLKDVQSYVGVQASKLGSDES